MFDHRLRKSNSVGEVQFVTEIIEQQDAQGLIGHELPELFGDPLEALRQLTRRVELPGDLEQTVDRPFRFRPGSL